MEAHGGPGLYAGTTDAEAKCMALLTIDGGTVLEVDGRTNGIIITM